MAAALHGFVVLGAIYRQGDMAPGLLAASAGQGGRYVAAGSFLMDLSQYFRSVQCTVIKESKGIKSGLTFW